MARLAILALILAAACVYSVDANNCYRRIVDTNSATYICGTYLQSPPTDSCCKAGFAYTGYSDCMCKCVATGATFPTSADQRSYTCSSGGDPVIQTWAGSSFELVGEAGKWFNLISEATHNINIRLIGAGMSSKANGGTLIDAIALLYNNNTVEASVDDAGDLTVVVNGQTITKEDLLKAANHATEVMLDDETAVIVELYRETFGHSMRIVTPLIDTTFFATAPGLDEYYQEYLRAYLNFFVGLKDSTVSGIHGLLGQTAPNSIAAKPRTLAASSSAAIQLFSGEGEESDYIVDDAFATEYKFAQFGKAPEPPTKQPVLKIARRSMIEQDKPIIFATMKLHA